MTRAQQREAAVLHCYSGKNGGAKDKAAREFGTWVLEGREAGGGEGVPFEREARRVFAG